MNAYLSNKYSSKPTLDPNEIDKDMMAIKLRLPSPKANIDRPFVPKGDHLMSINQHESP